MKKLIPLLLLLCSLNLFGQQIIINEYQSSNDTTIVDFEGDYPDWIELYNTLDSTINLADWFLSDDSLQPFKWKFPEMLFVSDGHLLVFASGKDTLFPNGELHTNFKICSSGEPLLLSDSDSVLIDQVEPVQINTDWSFGRFPDATNGWFYFDDPTPGFANTNQPIADFADPPEFSHQPDFYPDDIYLEISTASPGDTIYYTLDGSVPDVLSPIYTEPILLTNREDEPNNLSLIRTTLPGVGFYNWMPPGSNVYKFNIVRARVIKSAYNPSTITTSSFIVDPDAASRYSYPIISLISDSLNFFDESTGIYIAGTGIDSTDWESAHFSQRGREWEKDVHMEIFEPDGTIQLSQNAGVRIHGGYSRTANMKSLRLYARSEYGDNDFDYQFFPNVDQTSYKRILLRNTGQDISFAFMRDAFMQSLVDDFFLDTQATRHSIVFLNGEYWGIHFIRERYGKYYLEANYDLPVDNVDILENDYQVVEGDALHYTAMKDFIKNEDMSDSANYAYVKTQMDCENYINYAACNIFFCQSDWPQNNIKYWRKRTPSYDPNAPLGHDGRWRWFMYDTDYGFGRVRHYSYDMINFLLNGASGWSPILIQNLTGNDNKPGNEEFRNELINTLADLMNSNFKTPRVLSKLNEMKDLLVPEMPEHWNRWDKYNAIWKWNNKINVLISFAENRSAVVTEDIVQNFSTVTDTANVTLVADPVMGKIKINKLTIDEYTHGLEDPSQPYPWSGTYFVGVPVTISALPNPGYEFVEWQGLSTEDVLTCALLGDTIFTAIFQQGGVCYDDLHINEFMADNESTIQDPQGDYDDWIEIFNAGEQAIDLGGLYFTDDLNDKLKYQIPETQPDTTTLEPGGHLLFWADKDTEDGVLHLDFKLSKSGEQIGLFLYDGSPIDTLTFGGQDSDISMGCMPDGGEGLVFFTDPTPGLPNGLRQEIVIPKGWSGLSSCLIPFIGDVEEIFAPNQDYIELLSNGTDIYWPSQNINTIGQWSEKSAFQIKTSEAITLVIESITEANKEIELQAGWTMIPVLCGETVECVELFSQIQNEIVIVKEIASNGLYWPSMQINTLGSINPGRAYLILVSGECEIVYP